MSSDLIYHYCSLDTFKAIIESKSLWASSFRYLNDYSEVTVSQGALTENHDILLADIASSPAIKPLKRALKRVSLQQLEFYIVSFCSRPDKLNQWRSYADNGRGVAIGFRRSFFADMLLKDVFYGEFQHRLTTVCTALAAAFKKDDQAFKHRCTREFIELIGLEKSRDFADEEECRLIAFHDRHSSDMNVKFRRSGSFLVPYIEIDLAQNWSQNIAQVWLGPVMKDSRINHSIRHFLHSNGLTDVTLSESRVPLRQF